MSDSASHVRGWLRKAESDLQSARRLLEGPEPYDTTCYHAQQTVEKLLKALLAHAGLPIPRTHNLEDLQAQALSAAPNPSLAAIDLTGLTPFAVEMRYDFDFWPDRGTAAAAVSLAEHVKQVVFAAIPAGMHP